MYLNRLEKKNNGVSSQKGLRYSELRQISSAFKSACHTLETGTTWEVPQESDFFFF